MFKKVTVALLVVVILFMSGILWNLTNLPAIGQELDVPQLSSEEVLSIIARPLSNDSDFGFYLVNIDVQNANLRGVRLSKAQIDFSDFTNTEIDYADLSDVSGDFANFADSSIAFANLQGAIFTNSIFTNANFNGSNLNNATFGDANLANANFGLTSLTNTNFAGADISGAEFIGATLNGTILPDGSVYVEGDDLVAKFNVASNP